MQFDYDHIVKDLKFKITRGNDIIFEKQHGLPYKMIAIEGNGYSLYFDQIDRNVRLYYNTDFVRKVETLEELHELVGIIKFNPEKAKDAICKNLIEMVRLASSDMPITSLMQLKEATEELTERFNTNDYAQNQKVLRGG